MDNKTYTQEDKMIKQIEESYELESNLIRHMEEMKYIDTSLDDHIQYIESLILSHSPKTETIIKTYRRAINLFDTICSSFISMKGTTIHDYKTIIDNNPRAYVKCKSLYNKYKSYCRKLELKIEKYETGPIEDLYLILNEPSLATTIEDK